MVNQILAVSTVLGGVGLRLPVQQLPADGVDRIHSAGGELLFRFQKGHEQGIGLLPGKVHLRQPITLRIHFGYAMPAEQDLGEIFQAS